jgi:hypothetical protein
VAPGFFPLDEELQLVPNSPYTERAREVLVLTGTIMPFRQGAQFLGRIGAVHVSASGLRRVTQIAGAQLMVIEAEEREALNRTLPTAPLGPPNQVVSTDGAMVPLRDGTWREVRTLAIGRISRTENDRVTSDELSYVCRMMDAEHFADVVTGEVHRRGTEHAQVVAAVADGAPWCQQLFDLQVPGAHRILDFPHALQHLHAVAHAVFGNGTAAASEWLGPQIQTLRHGDPDQVLAAIAALPVDTARDPAEARTVQARELAFFTTRRAQIDYAAFHAAGLPIGSGIVESANKLVVEARLKGAGMHWSVDQVNPMVALRAIWCSDRWRERWPEVIAHQRQTARAKRQVSRPSRQPAPPHLLGSPNQDAGPRPRVKTIINGRPTEEHPLKKRRNQRT